MLWHGITPKVIWCCLEMRVLSPLLKSLKNTTYWLAGLIAKSLLHELGITFLREQAQKLTREVHSIDLQQKERGAHSGWNTQSVIHTFDYAQIMVLSQMWCKHCFRIFICQPALHIIKLLHPPYLLSNKHVQGKVSNDSIPLHLAEILGIPSLDCVVRGQKYPSFLHFRVE